MHGQMFLVCILTDIPDSSVLITTFVNSKSKNNAHGFGHLTVVSLRTNKHDWMIVFSSIADYCLTNFNFFRFPKKLISIAFLCWKFLSCILFEKQKIFITHNEMYQTLPRTPMLTISVCMKFVVFP